VRAVFELRHEEGAEHSGLTPNTSGLAHQSGGWRAYVGKSPPVLVPKSETVCANLGICILSHLLEHSLYTVLHLKHLNFGLYIETPKFTRGSRGRGDCCCVTVRRPHRVTTESLQSNQRPRQRHRRFFNRWWYLTPGWIQPPDKPVSGFDSMDPDNLSARPSGVFSSL
jgi:hypothetical protein